ncbi:MAG: transglutaminase family protein [Methylococcales bacterium]
MQEYLESSKYIDWLHPDVFKQARLLAGDSKQEEKIAKACFTFVRDEIKHSWDYQLNPVTCMASDVLKYGTGYCYAKNHLLAALLRANQIPAGLCYQRLTISDEGLYFFRLPDKPPFCLHGLNAIYLEQYGWYRVDARGNKSSVKSEFIPPFEQLAYPIVTEGEIDLPEIWGQPLPAIVQAIENGKDYLQVSENLPDIQIIKKYK